MSAPSGQTINPNRIILFAAIGVILVVGGIIIGVVAFRKPEPPPSPDFEKVINAEMAKVVKSYKDANRAADADKATAFQQALLEATGANKAEMAKLKIELEKAQRNGDSATVKQLSDALARNEEYMKKLGEQITEYRRQNDAAITNGQPPPPPPAALIDPPVPPPAAGQTDDGGNNSAQKFIAAAVMVACLYYPPACALVAILPHIGLFDSEEHRSDYRAVLEKIVNGKTPSLDELKKLAEAAATSKAPRDSKEFLRAVENLMENKLPADQKKDLAAAVRPYWQKIDDLSREGEPDLVKRLRKAMENKASLDAVYEAMPQLEKRPCFDNQNEKDRTEAMCKANPRFLADYWEAGLKNVKVK